MTSMQDTLASHTSLPPLSQYIQEKNIGNCNQLDREKIQMVACEVRSRLIAPISKGMPRLAMAMRVARFS